MHVTKKYDFIVKILIFSLAVVSLIILMAGRANAYERPEFTDGLTSNWHPGSFCIPCHYTLLGNERAREISAGCTQTCHASGNRPKDANTGYKIDMTKISKIHKDIICIKCHVGTKSGKNVTAVDFHRVMSKTACLNCHTFVNGTYVKPQKTSCSDCHGGGNPHVVHGKRIDRMCVACHGEFGEKYIGKLELPSNVSNMSQAIKKSEEGVKEYPTIGMIITRIIESLIR